MGIVCQFLIINFASFFEITNNKLCIKHILAFLSLYCNQYMHIMKCGRGSYSVRIIGIKMAASIGGHIKLWSIHFLAHPNHNQLPKIT